MSDTVGNVSEMLCVRYTGMMKEIVQEILPYTAALKIQDSPKFPGIGNVPVHTRTFDLYIRFPILNMLQEI